MKVLFDENLPFSLSALLIGHDCSSVQNKGWAGTKNGRLLRLAEEAGFQVMLTLDQHIQAEQNMVVRTIAVIVLVPSSQRKEDVRMLAPQVLDLLPQVHPGDVLTVRFAL